MKGDVNMHKCDCVENTMPSDRAHVFVDLNGFPYLLAEYMNRNELKRVDRTAIMSGINVDISDAMRAVIDISINDIGERSDCTPNILGNSSKTKRLLDMISRHANRLEGELPVLKSGIIMRVNYRLELQRTRQVIRSMVEDFRINDRTYILDINRLNFNDNAVIVNFNSSMVSTINEFTHGREPMVIRITNVQMFYELVSDRQPTPRIKQSMVAHPYDHYNSHIRPGTNEEYYYHEEMQHRHYIGDPPYSDENNMLCPPTWAMFNQFYHFDQDGRRIVLHRDEIYDPMRQVSLIPCGTVNVNRMFNINPGHRLIFKFSVWKNDITAVFDTLKVATALKAKFYNCCDHHDSCHQLDDDCCCKPPHHQRPPKPDHDYDDCDHDHHHHHKPVGYQQLISMLYDSQKQNERSGKMISELLERITALEDKIKELGGELPSEPVLPPEEENPPSDDNKDECGCGCDHEDIDPMPEDVVESIYKDVIEAKEGEI